MVKFYLYVHTALLLASLSVEHSQRSCSTMSVIRPHSSRSALAPHVEHSHGRSSVRGAILVQPLQEQAP